MDTQLNGVFKSYLLKRVLLVGFIATVLISTLFSTFQASETLQANEREISEQVDGMEQVLESEITQALWNLDRKGVQRTLAVIMQNRYVSGLSLQSSEMALEPLTKDLPQDLGTRSYPLVYHAANGSYPLGTLEISVSGRNLRQSLVSQITRAALFNLMQFLLVALALTWLFSVQVTVPFLKIQNLTDKFNREYLLPVLGTAGRAASRTSGSELIRLEENIAELQQNFQMLLKIREERTADLERANTELRESEAQLRQAQKMEAIGRLAGGVAHDFNNLLTVIMNCAELAQRQAPGDSEVRTLLEEVLGASQRAAELTRQLLAFSRRQVLQPKVLDLNGVIDEAMTLLRRVIGEDVEIRALLAPALAPVRLDKGQFVQVLMNLAVNARDAMPRGGTLTIETANAELDELSAERLAVAPGHYVLCSVSDTGSGMDAGTLTRLFEPFFTTKPVGRGTGLGLSIVYGIVKQSGGTISVSSTVGQGTTFKIYLPRTLSDATPKASASEEVRVATGSETVLLVDDDVAVRSVVRRLLEANGYVVLTATTPEEAIELASTHRQAVRVLLTDLVMPRMNGRQVAERVVALCPEARVIYMTGYAPDAIVSRGVLDEDMRYLEKPFTEIDLLRALRG